MSKKFGSIIESPQPVLIGFYDSYCVGLDGFHENLRNVSALFGNDIKVVKIDEIHNHELFEVLKIEKMPTYIIYQNEDMVWRHDGYTEDSNIIGNIMNLLTEKAVVNGS